MEIVLLFLMFIFDMSILFSSAEKGDPESAQSNLVNETKYVELYRHKCLRIAFLAIAFK